MMPLFVKMLQLNPSALSLTLATIAEQCGVPRPACGERATRYYGKSTLGPVRGRFHKLRLAESPPHPDLLPARGEKETALRPGHVRIKRQSHNTKLVRPGGGVDGADLLQERGREAADLRHQLLHLFPGHGRDAEPYSFGLGAEFRVLHGFVEGATKRGEALARHPGTGEEGGADLARVHDGGEHRPLIAAAGELDRAPHVGQLRVPR